MRRTPVALLAALLLLPGAARAQETGEFQVNTMVGWQMFDEAAALDATPTGALEAVYFLRDAFGVGLNLQLSRPLTRGDYFPVVGLPFSDSTFRYTPDQRTTQLGVGVMALGRFVVNPRLAPYVVAGVGRTRFVMDVEQNRGNQDATFTTWMVGGGVEVPVTPTAGVRLDLRNHVYVDFDRNVFDVSDPLYHDPIFPHPNPNIPEEKGTVHNLRLGVAFTFVPGREGR